MASTRTFVEYACGQMEGAGEITFRKMFGEYALYCDGKVVALVCDNALFVKPTEAGRAYAGRVQEVAPYQGAKPYFLIDDRLEDRKWLCGLIVASVLELPEAKPKSKGQKKG